MSTFTELKIGMVPITEEGVDRYRISDSIINHFSELSSLEDLNASVGRIWSEMKVPLPWLRICTANYITGTIEFNNPAASSLEVRGWIDSVEPVSDTEDFPVCRVKWHFDFWEMYKLVASYDYGQVKRRPFIDLASTPFQNYQYRFKKMASNVTDLIPSTSGLPSGLWWVLVSYNIVEEVGGRNVTRFRMAAILVNPQNTKQSILFDPGFGTKTYIFPSLYSIIRGELDEVMHITPDSINGVWMTPFLPAVESVSGAGTAVNPYKFTGTSIVVPNSPEPGEQFPPGFLYVENKDFPKRTVTFLNPVMSTEEKVYTVMTLDGGQVMELPYGMSVTGYDISLSLDAASVSLNIAFSGESMSGLTGVPAGLVQSVALPTLSINGNAWSSYVYSGEREYDIDTRNIQTNGDAWKSTVSGASSGAMMGAFGPQGLALGVAGGLIGGMTSYAVESLWQNDEIQKSEDRYHSKQPSNLMLAGYAWLSLCYSRSIILAEKVLDDYSASQLSNTRSNYGISVDEILASCDTLIRTTAPTGFYQIPNLIISGPLPAEAKDYIKQKFSAGVRLT